MAISAGQAPAHTGSHCTRHCPWLRSAGGHGPFLCCGLGRQACPLCPSCMATFPQDPQQGSVGCASSPAGGEERHVWAAVGIWRQGPLTWLSDVCGNRAPERPAWCQARALPRQTCNDKTLACWRAEGCGWGKDQAPSGARSPARSRGLDGSPLLAMGSLSLTGHPSAGAREPGEFPPGCGCSVTPPWPSGPALPLPADEGSRDPRVARVSCQAFLRQLLGSTGVPDTGVCWPRPVLRPGVSAGAGTSSDWKRVTRRAPWTWPARPRVGTQGVRRPRSGAGSALPGPVQAHAPRIEWDYQVSAVGHPLFWCQGSNPGLQTPGEGLLQGPSVGRHLCPHDCAAGHQAGWASCMSLCGQGPWLPHSQESRRSEDSGCLSRGCGPLAQWGVPCAMPSSLAKTPTPPSWT